MYPTSDDFTTNAFGDAWWIASASADTRHLEEYQGQIFAAQVQSLLADGVAPRAQTFDGSETTRITVDGVWSVEMLRSFWTYARTVGADGGVTQAMLDDIANDARAPRVSLATLTIAIWLTFHRQRLVDAGTRWTPPPLVAVGPDQIDIFGETVLPVIGQSLGPLDPAGLTVLPRMSLLDALGNVWTGSSAPAPTPLPVPASIVEPLAPIGMSRRKRMAIVAGSAVAIVGGLLLVAKGSST